jgi:hypothetical protein
MTLLRFPSKEEFRNLEKEVDFTPEESGYWDDMELRKDAQVDKEDMQGQIRFYLQELKANGRQFGKRVAVERRLKYRLGVAYELLGKKYSEGKEPLERADYFEQAVFWYQSADESVGFITDYAIRQAESCGGVAYFRQEARLDDEVTEYFAQRMGGLLSAVFGGLNSNAPIMIMQGPLPVVLRQISEKTLDSIVQIYVHKDHSKDAPNN